MQEGKGIATNGATGRKAAVSSHSPVPLLARCCLAFVRQERKAGMEEYAEKLAAASRRAEAMVKEFEEMGAGEGEGQGGMRCGAVCASLCVAAASVCGLHARSAVLNAALINGGACSCGRLWAEPCEAGEVRG